MTTYTVLDHHGEFIASGLSAREAAQEILTDDGGDYEIRRENDEDFRLYTRKQVANTPWTGTNIFSTAHSTTEAEEEIFEAVVLTSWPLAPRAMTDERYHQMLKEAE